MTKGRRILFLIGFGVLFAVSIFLFQMTLAIDGEKQTHIVMTLRELKQLDAEWNASVLKSRVGISKNYDSVSTPLPFVSALERQLQTDLNMKNGDKLATVFISLQAVFSEKEELVERFKSKNAVLKNSLHYLPTAVEELRDSHLASKATSRRDDAVDLLDAKVGVLLTDILRFNLLPDAELSDRIAAEIVCLEQSSNRYQGSVASLLNLVARHANIVLNQRVVEDHLMDEISNAPTAFRIDALNLVVEQQLREIQAGKQRFRTYLFIYSGFLLVLLACVAWRLIHSYRVIARINRYLKSANESLEQRVAARTAELEQQSAQLEKLAMHDGLTGLINRTNLTSRLAQALQRAERRGTTVVLMFFDLDGFKAVNDTCGHAVGDAVLMEVARRVPSHIRQVDSLARFGGDEFVILLDEVTGRDGAVRVAESVLSEINSIDSVLGYPVRISASIGISWVLGAKSSHRCADSLLCEADQAMYQAKLDGKGCIRWSEHC